MIVYKYFIKTAIRQKWIILGYTTMFLILSILNGADTKPREIEFTEKEFNIGIVNKDTSSLSKVLVDYLEEDNNILHMEGNAENIKEQVFLEIVDGVILIPGNFETKVKNKEKSLEILRDERKIESAQIENEVNKFLRFANASYKDGKFNLTRVKEALKEETKVELIKNNEYQNEGVNIWFKSYFNFTGYIIMAIYVSVIGLVMTEFNSKGIEDRSKISPKKLLDFNVEMYLGQLTIGIIITGIFILGSIALKGKYIAEVNFMKYLLNVSIFSIAILCFTFLINNITTNRFVINGVSTVVSLGTSFISGVLVPQEFLGSKVLGIAKFFPTYYFVKINNMKIKSFLDVRYEILMQLLFAITFFIMGLYFSKIKQKS